MRVSVSAGCGDSVDLGGAIDGGDLRRNLAGLGDAVGGDDERPEMGRVIFAAGRGNAAEVLGAVVVGEEVDGLAVGRKLRDRDMRSKRSG